MWVWKVPLFPSIMSLVEVLLPAIQRARPQSVMNSRSVLGRKRRSCFRRFDNRILRPLKTRKRRIEAALEELLPARRIFWAERCAWMAATLKEAAPKGDEFALVVRDLAMVRQWPADQPRWSSERDGK